MRLFPFRSASWLLVCLLGAPHIAAGQAADPQSRHALMAALDSLIATGEPRHTSHDEGERLQHAVDEAIVRGDAEIEALAIRAASPLTASISAPVSSTRGLPSITFDTSSVLRIKRAMPYTARVFASVDGGEFVLARVVPSGKGVGGRIDTLLPKAATHPGFHVVRLKAELSFSAGAASVAPWTETRTLRSLTYAIYDASAGANGPIRALVYGPASIPVRDLDPLLGDEPFATWLSEVLSARREDAAPVPDWMSRYCDERTSEAGSRLAPTAICSVVYFQARGDIGQIWFRTADIRETARGIDWMPAAPPRFEGLVIHHSAPDSRMLSVLPTLLASAPERPIGDVSILPGDIVISRPAPEAGGLADVTVTVRNVGQGDLPKAMIYIMWGSDPGVRGTTRGFVVDIPAQGSTELRLQARFPNGYGFVMAHGMQMGEHAPHDVWAPDPTPHDACAIRVVNPRLAPSRYTESLLEGSGCSGK